MSKTSSLTALATVSCLLMGCNSNIPCDDPEVIKLMQKHLEGYTIKLPIDGEIPTVGVELQNIRTMGIKKDVQITSCEAEAKFNRYYNKSDNGKPGNRHYTGSFAYTTQKTTDGKLFITGIKPISPF